MPKYVIEREIPKVGEWTAERLKEASKTSCDTIVELGPDIQWHHSFVTADKLYCVYEAANKEIIRKHSRISGIPLNRISEVIHVLSPESAHD